MTESMGTSVMEQAMARWSSPLESILFDTQNPDESRTSTKRPPRPERPTQQREFFSSGSV